MPDGSVIIRGYSTSDIQNNKLAALVSDTAYREIFLDASYKKYGAATSFYDSLTMHDADIAENGWKVNQFFYCEREKFHEQEHEGFLLDMQPAQPIRAVR